MKSFKKSAIVLFVLIVFSHCRKDDTTFNSFFYANWANSEGNLNLFIDDELKGELPYLSVAPTCDDDSLKQIALNIPLKSGKYKIEAKTKGGVIKSSGNIRISSTRIGVSGRMGGQGVNSQGGCTFIFLSE